MKYCFTGWTPSTRKRALCWQTLGRRPFKLPRGRSPPYGRRATRERRSRQLQPAALPEIPQGRDRAGDHQPERERVAVGPGQFREALEVHAVDRRDQGRRQDGGRGHREDLDDLVLVDVDEA